ncbi:MAG: family 10 glycosylhydrolase [Muribaculaceae bacterium]|nr:family 10 glycosylhydrolase [Muribaculaceae bacterium]
MKRILIASLIAAFAVSAFAQNPKREFRGAWLHTVSQMHYTHRDADGNKSYLRDQLDKLQKAGCNAILWQVRPSADAFYPSKLEPWSRFLSGKAGVAPDPVWDPLQFMIDECHARGMELHAWLNPYRVTTSKNEVLPKNHIYYKHPERFVKYGDKMYFDPGIPQNRKFIESVINDIITRYDLDGIHFDDYFYPYPEKGKQFPDSASYAKYGKGMKRDDWRRHNVDLLIEEIHNLISKKKPWIVFGISPFGIWRNKKSDPRGSDTNGLQNYDALYADVLLWTEKGWVDYMLPQLYWELEHKAASTLVLADWWSRWTNGRRMYYGQDVRKTMTKPDLPPSTDKNQLAHKIRLTRENPNVHGNCWWPGYAITENVEGVADSLATNFQSTVALVPTYPWISDKAPKAVGNLRVEGNSLVWNSDKIKNKTEDAVKWVVYYFPKGKAIDLDDAAAIQCVTWRKQYAIPADKRHGTYVVTSLSRVNEESKPTSLTLN